MMYIANHIPSSRSLVLTLHVAEPLPRPASVSMNLPTIVVQLTVQTPPTYDRPSLPSHRHPDKSSHCAQQT
jgi:hypothetical protein